jgi:hypothetical protein
LGGSAVWIVPILNIGEANITGEIRVGLAGFQFKKPALSTA